MKNKVTFLIPYFGNLPNYFDLFLKSCEYNDGYRWIVFTDDKTIHKWPDNVSRIVMTFDELKKKIQSKFDFKIEIIEPHKLCDYKPAYGYIFEEYLTNTDYWGHCDIDTILGNLDIFLGDLLNCNYDKLFCLGHMEIYKNTYENNRIFMLPIGKRYLYKESFASSQTTVFDEAGSGLENVNDIFKYYNKLIYTNDYSMNCSIVPNRFVKVTYSYEKDSFFTEKPKDALYVFNKGNLFRLYKDDKTNKIVQEDFLYIHLQLRQMKLDNRILDKDNFKILEDRFALIENQNVLNNAVENITIKEFNSIKRHVVSFRFFKLQIKWKINKLKTILGKINGKKVSKYNCSCI